MTANKQQAQDAPADNANVRGFVQSKMFANIFAEGMELVEETALYLDGDGRDAARELSRSEALSYASISMRLTTRLMQIASWLLVLRALRENEMTYTEAAQDRYRLGQSESRQAAEGQDESGARLPVRLNELRAKTDLLYQRISRIDLDIFASERSPVSGRDAASQIRSLQAALTNGL